jgi:hypothetical protein
MRKKRTESGGRTETVLCAGKRCFKNRNLRLGEIKIKTMYES